MAVSGIAGLVVRCASLALCQPPCCECWTTLGLCFELDNTATSECTSDAATLYMHSFTMVKAEESR